MIAPALTYGLYRDVNLRVGKAVTAISKGASLADALCTEGWLDAAAVPGLCVLNGPSPLLGGEPHHNLWLPWLRLETAADHGRLSAAREEELFHESLQSPWGTIGLIAQANQIWLYPQARHRPLLDAALRHWDEIDGRGAWYSNGARQGDVLWALPSNVKYVLANLGVPTDVLNQPLPSGGLATLTQEYLRS